ncbi:MAG: hypothetical protein HRU41_41230 [Saprospiraceae bacterium]|nr:hypothetical protein [Saprospiraceae bacterium]
MKSILFSLSVVSLFVISTYHSSASSSVRLEIPAVIDLSSANFAAIEQQIESSTTFAEIEVYDKWGERIYQSQNRAALFDNITTELEDQKNPLLYVLKFNVSEEEKLNSQVGQLVW